MVTDRVWGDGRDDAAARTAPVAQISADVEYAEYGYSDRCAPSLSEGTRGRLAKLEAVVKRLAAGGG